MQKQGNGKWGGRVGRRLVFWGDLCVGKKVWLARGGDKKKNRRLLLGSGVSFVGGRGGTDAPGGNWTYGGTGSEWCPEVGPKKCKGGPTQGGGNLKINQNCAAKPPTQGPSRRKKRFCRLKSVGIRGSQGRPGWSMESQKENPGMRD